MISVSEENNETEAFSAWRVGMHTAIAGSLDQVAEPAHQFGCAAFQIVSSSPRMWQSREPRPAAVAALRSLRERYNLRPLIIPRIVAGIGKAYR